MSTGLYCNSVLASLPQSTAEPFQRVQNAAARMIFNLGRHEHVTPCLIQLHWLPVRFRIAYKLCILMYNIRAGKCPCYLRDIMQPIHRQSDTFPSAFSLTYDELRHTSAAYQIRTARLFMVAVCNIGRPLYFHPVVSSFFFMVALCNRETIYIFILFLLSSFFFFFFLA